MSLNDDVDKLTGYYDRIDPISWIMIVTLSVTLVGCCVSDAFAEPPPTIKDIRRAPKLIETEPAEVKAAVGSEPGIGPMCIVEYLPPTHMGVLLEEAPSEEERVVVERAISKCERDVRAVADPWKVLALHRLEKELGVPKEVESLLIATWCWEGAMRSDKPIRGDFNGGRAHSFGPFQMQAWFWDWCNLPTAPVVYDDLTVAATCYWSRVRDVAERMDCPAKDRWPAAEAMAANGMKYKHYGCKARSKHWKELESWK
jgi:hypothetical protein